MSRILIVDDDNRLRKLVLTYVKMAGHELMRLKTEGRR